MKVSKGSYFRDAMKDPIVKRRKEKLRVLVDGSVASRVAAAKLRRNIVGSVDDIIPNENILISAKSSCWS